MKFINARTCYEAPLEGVSELVKGKTLMTEGQQKFFLEFMKEERPTKILEIGTNVGGTTAVILHAMEKLKLNAQLHSVDLGDYEATMRKTVDESLGVVCPDWNQEGWNIYCKTTVAGVLEEIGQGIDFCILDAAHMVPGEILDFLTILPFLKEGTVVVLHDVRLSQRGVRRTGIATNVLFSAVVASEKYLPMNDSGVYMNIAAFRVGALTREHIPNVIQLLSLPWAYTMGQKHLDDYRVMWEKYYPEWADYIQQTCDFGCSMGTDPVGNWDYEKTKALLTADLSHDLGDGNERCIVFMGYGEDMFLLSEQYMTHCYFSPLAGEKLANDYQKIKNRCLYVDLERKPEYQDYLQELGENMVAVILIPEEAQTQLKEALVNMGIASEKVFLPKDFVLGEKESLNYPTGVL